MADAIALQSPGPFDARLTPPGSKSLTNRALLLAALAEGRSRLNGILLSDDTRVMLDALTRLGVALELDAAAQSVVVAGCGGRLPGAEADLHLGNAGTAFRFLTAACCLGRGRYALDGIARMRERPISQLVDALRTLGADVTFTGADGFPPLSIRAAGLAGGTLTMPTTLSSQFVSALLLIAPCCAEGLALTLEGDVTSHPYVQMTLGLMTRFGAHASADDDLARIVIAPGGYRPASLAIEPDASNAAYFLAAAAVVPGSRCTIEGLGRTSVQGDVGFADLLHRMGAGLAFGPDFITVLAPPAGQGLRGIDVDLNAMPDMAQTLAVVALFAEGTTTMRRVGNLRVKETDRLAALSAELSKLGAVVRIDGDDLHVEPPHDRTLRPAAIDTYDDHRMAMSFAVAALAAPGVVINDPGCVSKTFPDFFDYLARLRGGS